ncbi:VIT1/CCC1 transporter family protein [Zavarzinia sp. CC-PAN008]|uniref:VIT1/CCC1 transporter family protein n=1 Tax=Zavarzinia sp. CC-PAN008 TaxID=3243332 RepID=UPI003F745ED3
MPTRRRTHRESHYITRMGWLRAAVLGANDGIVSTASLVLGVAAAGPAPGDVLVAGVAGLVAGALSMAAGEYVSVSSQADSEAADIAREKRELRDDHAHERLELAGIYRARGLTPELALQVADQLMAKDALGAHALDELGITLHSQARPLQAAAASAASFAVGAALPLLAVAASPAAWMQAVVAASALPFLAGLGALAARAGGAPVGIAMLRVTFWGAIAMAATSAIGALVGTAV